MPLLIRTELFIGSDPYQRGNPECYSRKALYTEEELASYVKAVRRDFKKGKCSYWFLTILRINHDVEDFVVVEVIKQLHPLMERLQLNAEAKGKAPKPRRKVGLALDSIPVTPSASISQMIAEMEAMQTAQVTATPQEVTIPTVTPAGFGLASTTTANPQHTMWANTTGNIA